MKQKIQLALILLMVLAANTSEANKYCKIRSCPKRSHTLCKHTKARAARACGLVIKSGLTVNEKRIILDLHSKFRRVLSKYTRRDNLRPQYTDTGYLFPQWDQELADAAQMWAEQCSYVVDECRNVDRFPVSQRVGVDESFGNLLESYVAQPIWRWYEEDRLWDIFNYTSPRTVPAVLDHTTHIGCGVVRLFYVPYNKLYLVCNYGPIA